MTRIHYIFSQIACFLCIVFLSSCAPVSHYPTPDQTLTYSSNPDEDGPLHQHSPVFVIEHPEYDYNKIGTPVAHLRKPDKPTISIDTKQATVFAEERNWQGSHGNYTNLIYRIHFSEIPFRIWPLHLGAGKNIGLFVIITLNQDNQPILITTLHTCGCYLAVIPTSFLAPEYFPENWTQERRQNVYGESLPGVLEFKEATPTPKITILIRESTHRVKDVRIEPATPENPNPKENIVLIPLSALTKLETSTGDTVSFFEIDGPRKDYVINSQKILERIFISWWALDWHVGEDKRLGRDSTDGRTFYTSLKPWDREASDLRDFSAFLNYWGWRL